MRHLHNHIAAAGMAGLTEAAKLGLVAGLKAYDAHPYRRPGPRYTEVFGTGELRLLRHANAKIDPSRTPLVLIPSLINRAYIMDLLHGSSFMRFMAAEGREVVLLDWGEPTRDSGMADFDRLTGERLLPALRYLSEQRGRPVDVAGYCLGGTMALAACAIAPDLIRKAVLLGAPWDFHAGPGGLMHVVAGAAPAAYASLMQREHLPGAWIQGAFAAAGGSKIGDKFAAFAAMDQDSAMAKRFVAVEDWLNDPVDLPPGLARACIGDFYGENLTGRGAWRVNGAAIDPSGLLHHILVVAATRDAIVPAASALAVARAARNAEVMTPALGHVGMMTGRRAKKDLWVPLAMWLDR